MVPPVFVINLPEQSARREFMFLQLRAIGVEPTVWQAVDGRKLSDEELDNQYDDERARQWRRPMLKEEIGCALSHIGVYRHIVDRNLPFAVVLEDDAAIGQWMFPVLKAIEDTIRFDKPAVVLLTRMARFCTRGSRQLTSQHRLVRPWSAIYTHGYVINQPAAKRLAVEFYPVFAPADQWKRLLARDSGIDVWGVDPYCVGHSVLGADSTIAAKRRQDGAAGWETRRERQSFVKRIAEFGKKIFLQLVLKPLYGIKRQRFTW